MSRKTASQLQSLQQLYLGTLNPFLLLFSPFFFMPYFVVSDSFRPKKKKKKLQPIKLKYFIITSNFFVQNCSIIIKFIISKQFIMLLGQSVIYDIPVSTLPMCWGPLIKEELRPTSESLSF